MLLFDFTQTPSRGSVALHSHPHATSKFNITSQIVLKHHVEAILPFQATPKCPSRNSNSFPCRPSVCLQIVCRHFLLRDPPKHPEGSDWTTIMHHELCSQITSSKIWKVFVSKNKALPRSAAALVAHGGVYPPLPSFRAVAAGGGRPPQGLRPAAAGGGLPPPDQLGPAAAAFHMETFIKGFIRVLPVRWEARQSTILESQGSNNGNYQS